MADEAQGGTRAGARIPTKHQLRAALQSIRVLSREDGTLIEEARHAYTELPTGGIFHSDELVAGECFLVSFGLLLERDGRLFCHPDLSEIADLGEPDNLEALILLFLERTPPLWLSGAASDGDLRGELIPDEAGEILDELIPDLARREALLLAAGRRHNQEALSTLGLLGENHVVEEWKQALRGHGHEELTGKVRRVSERSDQLGWDVDGPTLTGRRRKLEVKTTKRTGPRIKIHLSRMEARVGRQDPEWALLACRADEDDQVETLGWCTMADLDPLLPKDQHQAGSWESAALEIEVETLTPGRPPLD